VKRPPEGTIRALQAGSLAFLTLLVTGSLLVIAVKAQYASFGSGANPIEILTSLVIAALGILRAPVHIGDLSLTVLPLGALLLAGLGVAWATRSAGVAEPKDGVKVGIGLAVLCWVAALVFRHRFETDPVFAGAIGALFWGGVWGALFGWLAVVSKRDLRPRPGPDLKVGGVVVALMAAAASVALLLWIIVALIRDALPRGFDGGDALATVIYLVTFGPNLVVALIALSLGTPVHVGAQVRLSGRAVGRLDSYSLWDWAGNDPSAALWLLVAIPLAATVAGGMFARRRATETAGPLSLWKAAALVALVLGVVSWLAGARLGAGLLARRGFAELSADPLWVVPAAFAWTMIGGWIGWSLEGRRAA
jgi:hypothetical protein